MSDKLISGPGIEYQIQNGIIIPVEHGPGFDDFKKSIPEQELTVEKIKEFITTIFFDRVPKDKISKDVGVVTVYVDDETESYNINGKLITGRGGMKNLLDGGFVPMKVIVNGVEVVVKEFVEAFKGKSDLPADECE